MRRTRQGGPFATALAAAAGTVLGTRPAFEMCPGLLEIRWYAEKAIPAFAFGPGTLRVSHGPRELVVLEQRYRYTTIYALTAARVLS